MPSVNWCYQKLVHSLIYSISLYLINMTINANTKIAAVLKQHPDALEAIISISPKFEKLRNPLLRKLMAGRSSISIASKMGGCSINDFFTKLKPLGFEIDRVTQPIK